MIQTANKIPQFIGYLRDVLHRSQRTIAEYQKDLQYFVQWSAKFATPLDIGDVTEQIVMAYVSDMSLRGLSPATIRRRVSCARSFFRWLSLNQGREVNPAARIQTPRIPVRLVAPAPDSVVRQYLGITPATAKQHEVRFVVAMMFAAGLRLSEVLALRGCDFDFTTRLIHIIGKGNKERLVSYSPSFDEIVQYFVGGSLDPLFDNPNEATFRWAIIHALQHDGRGIHPHQLRHLFAVRCLENGMTLKTLSLIMGHANVKTTERYLNVDRRALALSSSRFAPAL